MAFGLRSVRNAGRAADGGMAVRDRRNLDLTLDDDDLMEQEHHDVDGGRARPERVLAIRDGDCHKTGNDIPALKDPVGFVPFVTEYLAVVEGYGGAELREIVLDVERVGDLHPDDKRKLYLIAYHRVKSSSIRTAALQDMEVPQSPAHFVAALYRACRGDVEEDIRCRVDELSSSKNTKGIDGVLGWLEDMRSLYERHLDDFRYVPAEDRTMIAVVASGVLAGYIQLHIGEPTCRQEARPTLMQWARDGRCR
jgi:hypothetical protein